MFIYGIYLYWAYAHTVLGVSRPSRGTRQVTPHARPRAIWAAGAPPSRMSWTQSPLPRSKLFKGCPMRARVPPRRRRHPHRSSLSRRALHEPLFPHQMDSTALLDGSSWTGILHRPFHVRPSREWRVGATAPTAVAAQHRHRGCVLLRDQHCLMTPRQWRGTPKATIIVMSAATGVFALLTFTDARAPPLIPVSVARVPPSLSYRPLSVVVTVETPDRRCAAERHIMQVLHRSHQWVGFVTTNVRVCNCCNLRMLGFGCKTVCVATLGFRCDRTTNFVAMLVMTNL
jgi:hypothetical protein